jgi:HK97 gp10 family phage protein
MSEFRIEGLENINKTLDRLQSGKNVAEALGKACAIVEAAAKRKAPKDTGALRRSITSKVEGDVGIVFTPLEYAPYVEYGTGLFAEKGGRQSPWSYVDDKGEGHKTSGQKPHPYLHPALEENRKKIIKILKEGILE